MTDNVMLQLGKGIVRTIDRSKLNATVKLHCLNRGLSDVIKDVHAQFTIKDHPGNFRKLSEDAVDRKIAALYNGDLRVHTPSMTIEEVKAAMSMEELEAELARRKKTAKTA